MIYSLSSLSKGETLNVCNKTYYQLAMKKAVEVTAGLKICQTKNYVKSAKYFDVFRLVLDIQLNTIKINGKNLVEIK